MIVEPDGVSALGEIEGFDRMTGCRRACVKTLRSDGQRPGRPGAGDDQPQPGLRAGRVARMENLAAMVVALGACGDQ